MHADDLGLIAETEKELLEKVEVWRIGMESKGLRVNMAKTKIMKCQPKAGLREETGKYPCGVCKKGVGANSILCKGCGKWIHKKCSKCPGKLKENTNFRCSVCVSGNASGRGKCKNDVKLLNGDKIEVVDKFCYLGDMIGSGGGVEETSQTRVRCAWVKFRELSQILTKRGVFFKIKGKL